MKVAGLIALRTKLPKYKLCWGNALIFRESWLENQGKWTKTGNSFVMNIGKWEILDLFVDI